MSTLTIVWIALPLFMGLTIYLLPRLDRYLAMGVAIASLGYALSVFAQDGPVPLQLLDRFGVMLQVDSLSGYFLLTNALVTMAVLFYCWNSTKTAFFHAQAIILHGSINAVFICADFLSLYVALEVIGIAAFLLIAYPRTDRSIWVALRYLFVSNTAMLFYLVGTIQVYQAHHSFAFAGLNGAPPEAIALIVLGLLTKGGVFISGLWLPLTHAESETPVSAMLSGIVVKAGIFPLVRCALLVENVELILRVFGVGAALLGVSYALVEKDTKRVLASSTVSQMGWIVAAPAVAGFYALAHGVVKAALFLTVGNLPSRNLDDLQQTPMHRSLWIPLAIASFSISGGPLLIGYGAKLLTMKNLLPWQVIAMNVAATGTALLYAKFIFLPHQTENRPSEIKWGFWMAIGLLLSALVMGNLGYLGAYTLANLVKVLVIILIGWVLHGLLVRRWGWRVPRVLEQLEHLIGVMSLMVILLFWMVLAP
jgi:multicomponent Na+:H+ antiporter subunit D